MLTNWHSFQLMSRFPKAILSELIPCGSNILNINRAMSSTSDAVVLVNEQENCGILTLNRPKFVNALNIDMIRSVDIKISLSMEINWYYNCKKSRILEVCTHH